MAYPRPCSWPFSKDRVPELWAKMEYKTEKKQSEEFDLKKKKTFRKNAVNVTSNHLIFNVCLK